MLELYHSINSVCAQKVRIALAEKGQTAKDHLMTLQGDQNDPAYMKNNPTGVVPTSVTMARSYRGLRLSYGTSMVCFPIRLSCRTRRQRTTAWPVQQANRRIHAQCMYM